MGLFNNMRDSWLGNNQKKVYDSTNGTNKEKRDAVNKWRNKNNISGEYERYPKKYHDEHYSGKTTVLQDILFGK